MDAILKSLLEMGAPGLVLSFAQPFLSAFLTYYFMRKLLPTRMGVFTLAALSLVYALWFNLRNPELFGTSYHFWMNIFINAFTIFIILVLFGGSFWRKIIVWWYFDIIKTMCQAISYVPILTYQVRRGFSGEWNAVVLSAESDTVLKLIHMATFIPVFALLGFLSLTIWRRILMRKFHPFYFLFIALPMGQLYSLARIIHPNMGDWFFAILSAFVANADTAYDILSLFGISLGLAASIAILYYVLSQDKRAAIEAELREAKREMELEQAKYSEMEKRGEELAKIRHDFNNQLASVVQLVRAGEDDCAQEIISALSEEINRTAQ